MVKIEDSNIEELVIGLTTIPEQVDDLVSPALLPGERMRREAEAFGFTLAQFRESLGEVSMNDFIDAVEVAMVSYGNLVEMDLEHRFIEKQYIRSCRIAEGTLFTTKTHGTEHPLAVMQGVMSFWTEEEGVMTYGAPNILITQPGARRIGFAHTEVMAVTFHPTEKTDLKEIEEDIIMKHTNRFLEGASK